MKVTFWILLVSFHAVIATELSYRNHTCSPSSYAKICILGQLHYNPDKEEQVIHSFPPNQSHVRIASDSRSIGHGTPVLNVNGKLYALLGRPAVLEVVEHIVKKLELPRALRHGAFPDTYMRTLTVEPGTDVPAILFLDLSDNYLKDISNVRSLVNLEMLLLSGNEISSVDPSSFKNLNKLKYLCLSHNDLSRTSLSIFPKSLTHLDLFNCDITSLNYGELYYPSMEMFNIEFNELTSIDGAALMLAMPKLKATRIGWNNFKRDDDDVQQAIQLFIRHNISLRSEGDDAACLEDDVEGICFIPPSPPRKVSSRIWMSLVVIMIVAASMMSLRWVLIVMNRK